MATLHDRPLQPSAVGTSRLRVLFLMDVLDGHQERFLEAYEQVRHQVAGVPGHISDQLCQSLGNSSQWLITSEWESSEPFLAWVDSPSHRELMAPMSACLRSRSSLRYIIARETPAPLTAGGAASQGRPAPAVGERSRLTSTARTTRLPRMNREVRQSLVVASARACGGL